MNELPILVSSGTLVPATPKIPSVIRAPLYLPHRLGLLPSPDRFFADLAYGPLKRLGNCRVETLSWLGFDARKESLRLARKALRRLMIEHPGRQVILVGQSQGGLISGELATEPEFADEIAAVVFAGVPWLGAEAIERWYFEWATVFPGVAEMKPGHKSLPELLARVESNLSPGIVVVVAASPHDELVSLESAMGVNFPDGTDVRRYYIDDQQPDAPEADVKYLPCGRRGRHVLMCRGDFVKVIAELREELSPQTVVLQAA